MGEVLTCLEHQSIPVRANRSPGEFAITTAQASKLARAKGIPADGFRWGHQSIQWRQFCGVIQLDGLTIEILPKIHGKESDPGSCRTVLIKMLRRAGLIKVHRGAGAAVHVQKHSLLDIFIQEFCLLVQEQVRIGKPRNYQQQENNLHVVRGKLLVPQQLRVNLHHRERLYCQFDELTDDILINQIVKYTLRILLPQCRVNAAKKAVIEQLMQHDAISDCVITSADFQRIDLNRTNKRYEAILAWCRLFIDAHSPDVTAGDHTLLSILFDMNLLFERWIAAELRPIARRAGFKLKEQSPRKFLAYRADLDHRPVFQTRPDISLVDSNGQVVWILDAKWKLLDPVEAKLGIAQQDLYQIAAYANRYQIGSVALAYPRQTGLQSNYQFVLPGGHGTNLSIYCLDLERQSASPIRLPFSKQSVPGNVAV